MSPRRDRDVLRLPSAGPKPPAEHPLAALNDPGSPRKGRRRRSPGPEDPRDEAMMMVIRHIQGLNSRLDELSERLQLSLIEARVHHLKIERLEKALADLQEPAGAVHATGAGRSDGPTPGSP